MSNDTITTAGDFLDRFPIEFGEFDVTVTDRDGGTAGTITMTYEGREYVTPWQQGAAYNTNNPDPAHVIECMGMDSRILDSARDALDLLDEGLCESAGSARELWEALTRQRDGLTALLGDEAYAVLVTVDEDYDN